MSTIDTVMVAIRDIKANPFRQLATYGLIESKLEDLQSSIHKTGFWPNVIGRRNSAGQVEIAYGHHRLEACRREFGEDHELPIHLQDIDDDRMLIIMADENSDDWANPTQHVRLSVEQSRDLLERALDECPDGFGQFQIQFADRPQILRAYTESLYERSLEQGVQAACVARFLGWGSWQGTGKDRNGNPRSDVRFLANPRVTNVWELIGLTERARAYLEAQADEAEESAEDEASDEAVEARRIRGLLEQDDDWPVEILDEFRYPGGCLNFRDAWKANKERCDILAEHGWGELFERTAPKLRKKDTDLIAAGKSKIEVAVRDVVADIAKEQAAEEDGAETEDEAAARLAAAARRDLFKQIDAAQKAMHAAGSHLNRVIKTLNDHPERMDPSNRTIMIKLMTNIERTAVAARRLERVVAGLASVDAIDGDIIEGEVV